MTDQSRVEAVARAMADKEDGLSWGSLSLWRRDFWIGIAQAAIEASDACMAEQGIHLPPLEATKLELEAFYREKAMDLGEELLDEAMKRISVKLGKSQ